MSVHLAILALLQASPGLVDLVGDRIYPDQLPDEPQYPAVTFQKVGGSGARGAVSNPGLERASFQVSTWARSRPEVVVVTPHVRKALDRKRRVVIAGVPIDDCFYDDDVDSSDAAEKVSFNHMTFTIHYRDPP